MPVYRYYTPEKLAGKSSVTLNEGEFHHFIHVVRGKVGDTVELIDGLGNLATAIASDKTRRDVTFHIENVVSAPPEKQRIIIAQAYPKANRLDFILEKGTELGMTELWLFPTEKSERKIAFDSHIHRMNVIMIAAMKQSGRLYLPQIVIKPKLPDLKEIASLAGFFGDTDPNAPSFISCLKKEMIGIDLIFFIGPESGFTGNEAEYLHTIGVKGVKLHPNILRTETAPLVFLSILSQLQL